LREQVVLREEIVVTRAWAAVEDHPERSGAHSAGEKPDSVYFEKHGL
jgi:hypothetical protein